MNTNDQLGRTLKAIKRDLEYAYVGAAQASVTGNATTARKMTSLINQISTDVDAQTL